jgi:hypothetical protein
MNLEQVGGSRYFVGEGKWFAGTLLTNPGDGATLVDSGVLPAGNYLLAVVGSTTGDAKYDLQHRDAPNTGTVKSQRRVLQANFNEDFLSPNKFAVGEGERVRCVASGAITGVIQLSIWLQRVA